MLGRFIAICDDDEECRALVAGAVASRTGLGEVLSHRGITVLAEAGRALAIGQDDGVVIGRLFTNGPEARHLGSLSPVQACAIVASNGEYLLDHFWGGYIAIVAKSTGPWSIIRDPSGEIPCYFLRAGRSTILASDAALIALTGRRQPEIDWNSLGHHLARMNLSGRRTALGGIEELLPGERLLLGKANQIDEIWTPWDHIAAEKGETGAEVSAAVQTCCEAWAREFDQITLCLSGGLDSSVIAACLAGQQHVTAVNFVSPSMLGDESHFAEAVATRAELDLQVRKMDASLVRFDHTASSRLPRPVGRLIGQASDAVLGELLVASKDGAAFNGEGGDNVFCFLQSPLPLVDRIGREGIGAGVWSTWKDTSRLTESGLWRSGLWAVRRMCRPQRTPSWPRNTLLLSSAIGETVDPEPLPVWYHAPAKCPPGKRAHVASIFIAQSRSRNLPGGQPVVSPLVSQPVIEAALRLPSWLWCETGTDRTPIRASFEQRLPAVVTNRRWKGGPDAFCLSLLAERRHEIRGRLLEGRLSSEGLIDRTALEHTLSDAGISRGVYYLRTLELLEAEAWVQHWLDPTPPRSREWSSIAASAPSLPER